MGITNSGILGKISGKVGPVVGSSWKGINTIRQYVIPSNPQTVGQVAQRDRMAAAVVFAQQLKSTIIDTFFNPFAVKMSGFNSWIKENVMQLAATTFLLTVDNVMSKGGLESTAILTAVLAAGDVTITWDESIIGNGALTDGVDLFVIAKSTGAIYANVDTLTRDDETGDVTVLGGEAAADIIAFLVVKRGSGSTFVVSNSTALQVTA